MSIFNINSKNSNISDIVPGDKAKGTITGIFNSITGINRTDGITPIGIVGRNLKREKPGFTPNSSYVSGNKNDNDSWYGALLEAHPDYTGNSSYYLYGSNIKRNKNIISTADKFNASSQYPNFAKDLPDSDGVYSTRDYYLLFNDTSTDYFKHGLHVIDNKTPIRSEKNSRESWDGYEEATPQRLYNVLSGMGGTPYENNDPVLFGFEVIIDAVSSPLLNGSVEDFINQFSSISEVGARKYVMSDFKQQFMKLFKTRGKVFIDPDSNGQIKTSIVNNGYPNLGEESQSNIFQAGRKAYMSYYLKKIAGLEMLIESNLPSKKKYLTDYRNDVLKLTFNEDVSSSLGTLSHLYKLLYWSKPNGKSIIPENILRFNCDIIVSEIRNLNRVRKAIDTNNLEVVKENVSRHIYSLKECQFYFDQTPHDIEIDMSQAPKEFDSFTVTMDYKYVTSKFERWVPDGQGFGKYVGYNNGAIWKIGNPGSRGTQSTVGAGTLNDNSVPKFFSANSNTFKQNGVKAPIVFESYSYIGDKSDVIDDKNNANKDASSAASVKLEATGSANTGDEDDDNRDKPKESRKKKIKDSFEQFKQNSKKASVKLSQNLERAVTNELRSQINIRLRLLNNTLDKIRNASGVGRMSEPSNIYKVPYFYQGVSNGASGQVSSNFFFDVHNSLRNFAGDAAGNALGGKIGGIFKGGNGTTLF
jgi:hypothetical protein